MRIASAAAVLVLLGLTVAACGDDDGSTGNDNVNLNANENANRNTNTTSHCGNGVVEPPEACDDATANSATVPDACRLECTLPRCGDGVVDPGPADAEQCDPPAAGRCDGTCRQVDVEPCDAPGTYDASCVGNPDGQWCSDGGTGEDPFCGCDPAFRDLDCHVEGFEACDPVTHLCGTPLPCGADGSEPNDDEDRSVTLDLGTPVVGNLCAYDVDWFAVTTGPEDTALVVALTWTGAADLDLRLTDCAGAVLGVAGSREANQEVLRAIQLEPGTRHCLEASWFLGTDAAVDYQVRVTGSRSCSTDADCPAGSWCPGLGPDGDLCVPGSPSGAGCGDDVPGEDDTWSLATELTSGVGVFGRATCDGTGTVPDVDFYAFEVADHDRVTVRVQPGPGVTYDQLGAYVYDAQGKAWGETHSGTLDASGYVGGRYYLIVLPNPNDSVTFPAPVTYDATVTVEPSPGCAVPDHCGSLFHHGDCVDGFCVDFEGNGSQGPLEPCDDEGDCDPATTGSPFITGYCISGFDPTSTADSFCVTDCDVDADCQLYSPEVFCAVLGSGSPAGMCLPRCFDANDCFGLECQPDGRCTR